MAEELVRLNKYLAMCGVCSRRDADQLIEAGRVSVNGVVAENGRKVGESDIVEVNGKPVHPEDETAVYAYYKPVGVTCTARDPHAKRVLKDEVDLPASYTYAGRLDRDSEGLLLLTNDGLLIQGMMRAANYHEKEYLARVDREITEDFLERMKSGIYLKELQETTRPCKIKMTGIKSFRIILTQGLNRQIRRMCETLGYHVLSLKRERVLTVTLGDMKPGEIRKLTKEETEALYAAVRQGRNNAQPSYRK